MTDDGFSFIGSNRTEFAEPMVSIRGASAGINSAAFRLLEKPTHVTCEATEDFCVRIKACAKTDINACYINPAAMSVSQLNTFARNNGLAKGAFPAEFRDGALYAQLRKAERE